MNDTKIFKAEEMKPMKGWQVLGLLLTLFAIYLSSFYDYLLFHGISETFSVLIAFAVFLFAWNSRAYLKNSYFLFIGVAYFFVGTIDMAHTFAYKGMGIFVGFDANLPTQLWIVARFLESLSLLIALLFFKRSVNAYFLFVAYLFLTILLLGTIFIWDAFPVCFIEGSGLTPFKKNSEYFISLILVGVIILFYQNRSQFDSDIHRLLVSSVVLTIIAELAFTFYVSVYGLSNLIGHFLKIISFYLIYLAIIKTGLKKPYDLLFRSLKKSEEVLREVNQKLTTEITEHKKAQAIIQENEKKYRQMFEDNTAIKLLIDPEDGSLVDSNQAALRYYGYQREQFNQMKITDINTLSPEKINEEMQHAKLQKRKFFNFRHRLASGEIRDVEVYSGPIKAQGKTLLFSIIHDCTDRKQAEKALVETQHLLIEAQRMAKLGSWDYDLGSGKINWSEGVYSIFGLDKSYTPSLEGLAEWIHPDDLWAIAPETIEKNTKAGIQEMEYRIIDQTTGKIKHVIGRGETIKDTDGNPVKNYGSFQDITERKKTENHIKASLEEKETLLHEIHHRVKNNMQVISSLLKLQSNDIADPQVKEILKESQSRVYAMSAVHETLHGSEKLSEIDLKSYLSKITTSVFQTYSADHRKVKLNSNVDNSPISINQAYPLGLIINELVSNSLKYAFSTDNEGVISVSMKKSDQELELCIGDDGVGMPEGLDWKNSDTLGLKLVRTLVENQLEGSIEMESDNGTKFTIKFNIDKI
jgi:PAS domain S-box-containing protein